MVLTRVDPVLPLYRYRLEETVLEVRLSDLAFTADETRHLVQLCGVDSDHASSPPSSPGRGDGSPDSASRLWSWSTATTLRSRCELTGDRGNIGEYLMAEVLQTQPADVRTLLMHTSIVDALQPGLIEELGGPRPPARSTPWRGRTCWSRRSPIVPAGTATTRCCGTCCAPSSRTTPRLSAWDST